MPESPEVQAHAERMTAAIAGKKLTRFELCNFAALKTFDPPADAATGRLVTGVTRRGKFLVISFEGENNHVIHLMQGGRIRVDTKRSAKPRFGIARWVFGDSDGDNADSTAWLLTEAGTERKAGIWAVNGEVSKQDPLNKLGPDAASLTVTQLKALLDQNSKRLHGLLRRQQVVAGLGRMLANEICFEAKLSPFTNASKLNDDQVKQLHAAIRTTVKAATDHERTLDDIGKSVDRPSKVHNRSGESCVNCDDTIRTVEYRRYTVYYCPTEQTQGKLLADNTTSKFLK